MFVTYLLSAFVLTNKSNTYTYQIEKICKPYYTVHGLWPNDGFYCQNEPFNISELDPIREDLDYYWPSCYGNTNEWFWEHEWKKHGTCTDMNQLGYFNKSLNLLREYSNKCYNKICDICFDYNFSKIPC